MIKALVFDLGGTLVDDREMIYKINSEIIMQFGKTPLPREEYDRLFTSNWPEIYRRHGVEADFKTLIAIFMEKLLSKEFLSMINIYAGTHEFLQISSKKMKLAINTSYRKDEILAILNQVKLNDEIFTKIVGHPEDIGKLKPHPESLLNIAKHLNMDPSECLMIGDTSADILCGKNSGAKTCAVSWGMNDIRDLEKLQPDIIAHSWKDVESFIGV